MITSVTKVVTFDAAHRLLDNKGPCGGIHGHTYKVEITIEGPLQDDNMIMDFSFLKDQIIMPVINKWDHTLLLNKNDPLIKTLEDEKTTRVFTFEGNPTAEIMAHTLITCIRGSLTRCTRVTATVWETPTSYATVTERLC